MNHGKPLHIECLNSSINLQSRITFEQSLFSTDLRMCSIERSIKLTNQSYTIIKSSHISVSLHTIQSVSKQLSVVKCIKYEAN